LLANLAVCLNLHYEHTHDQDDLAGAVSLWRAASEVITASAWLRLDIARTWARAAMVGGRITDALLLQLRGELAALARHSPMLATRLEEVRAELQAGPSGARLLMV
jgi:hypothetical protein